MRKLVFLSFFSILFLLSACTATVNAPSDTGTPTNTSGPSRSQIHGNTAPDSGIFHTCPARGDGGSAMLNTLKNRTDTATWVPTPFDEILTLPWPKSIEHKDMEDWSAADASEIAKNNGRPVSVTGYLAQTKREGPETPNCHLQTDRDYHIWLVKQPNGDRSRAIVVEATPRLQAQHPSWNSTNFTVLVRKDLPVRISGWTMLDPEHPDDVGQSRGTIWEIHPIMLIEVQLNGAWVSLDDAKL